MLIWFLTACRPDLSLTLYCDPRTLEPGEVRIRRVPCSDELIVGGEGQRSDWLLENAHARFIIRDVTSALSRPGTAGGGLVDAVSIVSDDVLTEALPQINGAWFLPGEVTAIPQEDDGQVALVLEGRLPSGAEVQVRYTLLADDPTLQIEGIDSLSVVPSPGVAVVGTAPTLLDDGDDLLGFSHTTPVEDLGGWLTLSGVTAVTPGDRSTVHAALWPTGAWLEGDAEGEWLESLASDGQTRLARLPIRSGHFSGHLPDTTAWLRATAAGHREGEPVALDSDRSPAVGPYGALSLAVVDLGSGQLLPARLHWQGQTHTTLPDTETDTDTADAGLLLTGPGEGLAWIEAGPAHEAQQISLAIGEGETVERRVRLRRAVTPAILADMALITAPDRTERRDTTEILTDAAGRGIQFALLLADDEITRGQANEGDPWVEVGLGSRSTGRGTPASWPWSANARDPAHGAIHGADLSAADLLAAMSERGNRTTLVTTGWVQQTDPLQDWLPYPDLLRIDGLDDLGVLVALYDAWQPLPVVGPLAWIEGIDPTTEDVSAVDIEAMLAQRRSTATNGPRPVLRVGDLGPGDLDDAPGVPLTVTVSIEAPAWMPLTDAALIGPDGVYYARWSLADGARLEGETVVLEAPPAWLVLACWGEAAPEGIPWMTEPPWAVTSPLWLASP